MDSIIESARIEIADNWPAFVYIALTVCFSIMFLRERRAETEALRQIGAGIHARIDRVERMIRNQQLNG